MRLHRTVFSVLRRTFLKIAVLLLSPASSHGLRNDELSKRMVRTYLGTAWVEIVDLRFPLSPQVVMRERNRERKRRRGRYSVQ